MQIEIGIVTAASFLKTIVKSRLPALVLAEVITSR